MDKYAANPSRDGQRGAEIAQLYKQWEAETGQAEALEGASQGLERLPLAD